MHTLENETNIYQNLSLQARKDTVAKIVLSRIEKEIETIKVINEQKRKERPTRNLTHRIIQYVFKALHRCWHNEDRGNNTLSRIPTRKSVHEKEATR